MAFDFGFLIAGAVVFYIIAISYKKKTGKPIGELWRGGKQKAQEVVSNAEYRKVYVTRGIKQ